MRKVISSLLVLVAVVAMQVVVPTPAPAHVIPKPCDFTTGGGFVFNPFPNGARINFGLVGGCKHGSFFGHVNIVDRSFPLGQLHVSSTSIDAYFDPIISGSGYRDICGTARTNLVGDVKFRVRTKDNGEPGGDDRFGFKLAKNGATYTVSVRELGPPGRTGGGGNIQLHKPNPSTTGPDFVDEIVACGADDSGLGF